MAPGALLAGGDILLSSKHASNTSDSKSMDFPLTAVPNNRFAAPRSYLLNRNVQSRPLTLKGAKGNSLWVTDGQETWEIFDASGGAAVSCIGHGDGRVYDAQEEFKRKTGVDYAASMAFDTDPPLAMAEYLIKSTNHDMKSVEFYGSGSEAVEAAGKLSIQYHAKLKPNPEPSRRLFIARERSYHGATLLALELSGHKARKHTYQTVLPGTTSFIPPCYPYRGLKSGETEHEYVARLANDLDSKIQELGPENVAAYIAEPIVGAALGCVPAVKGYLRAMKNVCEKYGVLFIADEVMCGMGRTGYLHAWQKENVVPDIQVAGKGLAGGYAPISAILVGDRIDNALGSGTFSHGHTFQNYAPSCVAALAVQQIIFEEDLLANVRKQGAVLRQKLEERLSRHRFVGDIRGEGHFLGIEFVANKDTKEPFSSEQSIASRIHTKGLSREYGIFVYPGSGTKDGWAGDHIIIAPAFNITSEDVDTIVNRVHKLIEDFFDELDAPN